ncbi:phosphoribosylaminoimidazolesuccinocarboxamide synthase, partial [uncultured Parolsenella sp.]|uniref:phosphoribosylaminoimidazolesuccinocarboxamide synthase n=1 Tax=uncultured Parolsenella sp. TaxID=2083008 RepID=UPI0027D932B4
MTTMDKRPDSRGKVRDIYDCGDSLLMVASDRISCYDYILPDEIPHKGEILTRISKFWFKKFADIMPNHVITMDPAKFPAEYAPYADYLVGRSMLVKKAKTIPIECIVRGY